MTPTPGSDAAIALGCSCPVLDNHHGKGTMRSHPDAPPVFWVTDDCPLHARKEKEK